MQVLLSMLEGVVQCTGLDIGPSGTPDFCIGWLRVLKVIKTCALVYLVGVVAPFILEGCGEK